MTITDAQAWVLIIGTVGGVIVSIVTAMNTKNKVQVAIDTTQDTNSKVMRANEKIDEVHILTNKNFTEQKHTIDLLQAQITSLISEAAKADAIRVTLASEAAKVVEAARIVAAAVSFTEEHKAIEAAKAVAEIHPVILKP